MKPQFHFKVALMAFFYEMRLNDIFSIQLYLSYGNFFQFQDPIILTKTCSFKQNNQIFKKKLFRETRVDFSKNDSFDFQKKSIFTINDHGIFNYITCTSFYNINAHHRVIRSEKNLLERVQFDFEVSFLKINFIQVLPSSHFSSQVKIITCMRSYYMESQYVANENQKKSKE